MTYSGNYSGLETIKSANWPNEKGISIGLLFSYLADQTDIVNDKLVKLKSSGSSLSITDMFEMQMKMNRLSQFSEMSTAVVSAASGAIQSIARNVK
jgi:hypothetical protein